MNDSKRDVRLSKRNKSANAVLKQVSGSNLDGITNVNKQDEKPTLSREKTFVKYASEKEIPSPHLSDITCASRSKPRLKFTKDIPKKLRKSTEAVNLTHRSAPAHKSENASLSNRTRSASPLSPCPSASHAKKISSYHLKISEQLETIKECVHLKPEEADSLVEVHRQKKRANEFGIRFSRNHLYQLRRLVTEIKRVIVPYPFETLPKNESENLSKKIFLTYQTASQALQTYINYVGFAQNSDVPEKLRELILLTKELYQCCEDLLVPKDAEIVFKKCKELLYLLDIKIQENDDDPKNKNEKDKPKENRPQSKRYSMYKAKPSATNWKKKTEALARVKFGPPPKRTKKSEDKRARVTCDIYTQKLHPKCGKYFGNKFVKFDPMKLAENSNSQTPPGKKVFPKKSRYFTPREVTSQDDDIETAVQSFADEEPPVCGSASNTSDDESCNLDKSEMREILLEAIQHLQTCEKEEQKTSLKKLLKSIKDRSKPVETKASNVQVLHIKSKDMLCDEEEPVNNPPEEPVNNPPEEPQAVSPKADITQLHKEQKALEALALKERRLNMIFKPIKQKKKSGDEETIVPRGKIRLTIPDEMHKNVIKYKKMFKEYCRNNIMYQTNMARKPWEVVARIADHLITDILADISSGIEDDGLLQRLYMNELLDVV